MVYLSTGILGGLPIRLCLIRIDFSKKKYSLASSFVNRWALASDRSSDFLTTMSGIFFNL